MAGTRPKYSLKVKSKKDGTISSIAAVWQNDRGLSFTFDRDVESVRLKDGTTVTLGKEGSHYGNVYGDTPPTQRKQSQDDDPFDL